MKLSLTLLFLLLDNGGVGLIVPVLIKISEWKN